MLQLLQTVAAPWQHGKNLRLILGWARAGARLGLLLRLESGSVPNSLLLGAAPFMTSLAVDKFPVARLSLSLSLSFPRVFAISHASLPPNQLVKRRTRLYTPNWHSYSCLIFIFMFIFTQVSLSLPLSLVQLASFIKIDRKS